VETSYLFIPKELAVPAAAARHYGGKAAGLLRLRALRLPVPEFVVLPAALFAPGLAGCPTTPAGLAGRRARLAAFELPAEALAALRPVLAGWGFPGQPVAVRSSVADEDGAAAAFPGLMDTVLSVSTWPELRAAVARVAASAYSERALAYRRRLGLPLAARPAVVVQRQVAARAAGVLFSTFPEYPQEVAIHAVAGLGEGLVNGQRVPQEYYLDKISGAVVHTVIPEQEPGHEGPALADNDALMGLKGEGDLSSRSAAAEAATLVAYPPAAPPPGGPTPLLSPDALAELHCLSQQLEAALGQPQDVEFAQDAAGRLWLVQARPLTQAVPEVVVYDNANIQESYCGVTTPLTFSFAQRAYATVYRQTMRALGLPAATIAAHEAVITNLLALRQGRIYYNLNNWYRGLQLLPNFRQSKADMERMMGVLEPVGFVRDQRKTPRQRLALLPRLAANLGRLLWAFRQLPRRAAAFGQHVAAEGRHFYRQPLAALPPAALLAALDRLDEALLNRWTTPIINDFRVMMANGAAGRRLRQAGLPDPEEWLSRYLSGGSPAAEAPLASLRPALALRELAHLARRDYPALLPHLRAPTPRLPADVARLAPALHQQVQDYVARYGDRTIGELKLETETMRTDELLVYKYLQNYLAPADEAAPAPLPTPAASLAPAGSLATAAAAELTARLAKRGRRAARRTWAALATLRQAVARREELRLARTRLFGMYRAAYRALGQRLAEAGTLAAPPDVFFLTEAEVRAALAGGPEWAPLVAARQAEFAAYRAASAPPGRLLHPVRPAAPETAPPADGRLRGTGCYPGEVRGEVVVITDPALADVGAVRGYIVAALRTDPGWAALFPGCRAVLIERGSALSHSVILLRELGIPTIINIPGLTRQLQTGQLVALDGRTGELAVVEG